MCGVWGGCPLPVPCLVYNTFTTYPVRSPASPSLASPAPALVNQSAALASPLALGPLPPAGVSGWGSVVGVVGDLSPLCLPIAVYQSLFGNRSIWRVPFCHAAVGVGECFVGQCKKYIENSFKHPLVFAFAGTRGGYRGSSHNFCQEGL